MRPFIRILHRITCKPIAAFGGHKGTTQYLEELLGLERQGKDRQFKKKTNRQDKYPRSFSHLISLAVMTPGQNEAQRRKWLIQLLIPGCSPSQQGHQGSRNLKQMAISHPQFGTDRNECMDARSNLLLSSPCLIQLRSLCRDSGATYTQGQVFPYQLA